VVPGAAGVELTLAPGPAIVGAGVR
jgi:hypothetical protein